MTAKSDLLIEELVSAAIAFGRQVEPDWQTRIETARCALKAYVAELEAAERWIPVSERLPEFNKVVAVIDMSDKDSHLCNVYETAILVEVRGDTRFGFIGHSGWDSSDVTHWMPLPELPEVQE